MTIRPPCSRRVIHRFSEASKHLLRSFDAVLVPDCYVDNHCKHLSRMWLSPCVCLGACVQVHTARGGGGGGGGERGGGGGLTLCLLIRGSFQM